MLVPAGQAIAAAAPQFSQTQAIEVAASDPAIAPIMAAHPGAYWTARYLPAKRQWIATLHAKTGKPPLARFTDRRRARHSG